MSAVAMEPAGSREEWSVSNTGVEWAIDYGVLKTGTTGHNESKVYRYKAHPDDVRPYAVDTMPGRQVMEFEEGSIGRYGTVGYPEGTTRWRKLRFSMVVPLAMEDLPANLVDARESARVAEEEEYRMAVCLALVMEALYRWKSGNNQDYVGYQMVQKEGEGEGAPPGVGYTPVTLEEVCKELGIEAKDWKTCLGVRTMGRGEPVIVPFVALEEGLAGAMGISLT